MMTEHGLIPVTAPARVEPLDSRLVTILYAGLCDAAGMAWTARDAAMERVAARFLSLLEIIITREEAGQVLQSGGDFICAVFEKASDALNRSLEIQRVVEGFLAEAKQGGKEYWPRARLGLHLGEVLLREGGRVEVASRQVTRARRVMEAAGPGQVYASEAVLEAGRDFVDLPHEFLAIHFYGEYLLFGTGVVALGEAADRRFGSPAPPRASDFYRAESARVGRLELAGYGSLKRVGEGPMGVTYQAREEAGRRRVAIKVLASSFMEEAGEGWKAALERLEKLEIREAGDGAAAKGSDVQERLHPSKAGFPPGGSLELSNPLLDSVDGASGRSALPVANWRLDHRPPFLAREWIEGRPLDEALRDATPERVARVFYTLCQGLAWCHGQGLAHLNLKPNNVLVTADDGIRLLDWGLVRGVDRLPLNPAWAAPEQIQGKETGPAADIYAVGALLFRVLAGREPFPSQSVQQVLQSHLHEDPPLPSGFRPGLADGLQRICLKALEKSPEERYASLGEMAADLSRFLRGEAVRTRPTAYDNLLYHRAARHLGQVKEWMARGLLSVEESNRLLAAYEGLQRRGLPAAMETRVYPFWQTLVYVGGWAVVNGALLWLALHWRDLGRAEKLLLGSLPALATFALGFSMMQLERYRLAFVALVVGILATPLLAGVWLHEFRVAARAPPDRLAYELFYSEGKSDWLTNGQILWAALATVGVAASISLRTRTTTHSAQTAGASVIAYAGALLFFGLKPRIEAGQWAVLGLQSLPLLGVTAGIAGGLLRQPGRQHQAVPWIYCVTGLVLGILYALALQGLEQWTSLEESYRRPASWLLLAVAGALQAGLGLAARQRLKHRARSAALLLVLAGLGNLLAGLALAGLKETWPASWPAATILGQALPWPHLWLLPVSLVIALLACRFQMFSFLGMGLAGIAGGVHLLGELYFQETAAWPRWIMLAGVAAVVGGMVAELRGRRGGEMTNDK